MKRTIVSVLVILIMVLGGFGYLVNISSGWNSSQEHQGLSTKDTNVIKVTSDRYETRAVSSTVSNTVYISGTYIINQTTVDPLTGQRGKYGFDANVVVTSTGKLIVENATLYFLSDVNHRYSLTVNGGLYFYNVTFTIAHGLVEPYFPFKFIINGPSYSKVEIINSRLLFPGWFNVTNKNGNVIIYNTTFGKMSSSPTDYPAPPSYGPTPYFYNSKVYIGNTQFRNLFKNQTGGNGNIGWINDTTGYIISSSSGAVIDNFQESKLYPWYWDYVVLKNVAVRVDYSNSTGYASSSNFIVEYENQQLLNMTIQALSNGVPGVLNANIPLTEYGWTPNQFYQKLSSGDIRVYVTNSKNSTVTISKVSFGIEIEKNLLKYGINKFSFNVIGSTLYLRNVYVDVDYSPRVDLGVSHNMFYFTGASRMYALNLTINDTGKSPRYDTAFLMNDSNSEAYILRYSLTKVYFRNISLDGLTVSATPYPVDFSDNSQLISEMVDVMRTYVENTALIPLMKLGDVHISGNEIYDKTVNGRVYLPLLSDIINQTEEPNSKFVGVYQLSVRNSTKEFYHAQIGLGYYPWLLVSNNTYVENITLEKYKDVDIGVKSVDVVSASPYVPGRSESIRVSVENYGKDEADGVEVYVYINGNLYKVYDVGVIGGEESKEYEWEINGSEFLTNGNYNISVDVVQEWDYNLSNNRGSVLINVGSIWVSAWSVGTPVRYHSIWVNVTLNSVYSWNNVGIYLYLDNRTVVVNSTVTKINKGLTEISFGWYISDNVSAGSHTLLVYLSNGVFLGSFSIDVKKDIDLAVSSLSITPTQVYIGETLSIQASIVNFGKEVPASAMVYINIYDPLGTLVQNKTFAYPSTYALSFVPNMVGDYRVEVKVVAPGDYVSSNNVMSKVFTVYAEPFTLSISAGNEYVNGTNIVVNVTVTSNVDANASLVLYIPEWNMALNPITPKNPVALKANTPVTVAFLIQKTFYQRYLKGKASINVVYQINITSDITGNAKYVHPGKEFVIKEKTNFVLSSLLITQGERQVSTVAEGVKISIHFIVRNYGGLPGALDYVILDNGKPLIWGKAGTLAPGNYKVIFYNYTVTSLGTHNIEVKINPNGTVQESIYGDDVAVKKLNVIMPSLKIIVTSYSLEHNTKVYVGDTLVVVVKIINMNATESQGKTVYMKGVKVQLILTGGLGTYTQTTNAYGLAIFHIKATAPGTYNPQLQLTYQGYVEKYTPSGMAINVEKKPFTLPWLWIIIIVIVAAIGGFFLYGYITFKREAPEYMVCGNCGHLIPADSEKCPYCGVVFEKEKVKCPECGSWIDEDAKFCPVCGTIFMPPEDPEFKKYEKLKENYEKYIGKYKEEAKKYIGEKFTTEEFFKWWKTHPEFISFLEWVKRQEEKIEGATVRCPVCGSLNPKGAKICRVCGSPLPVFEEKEHEERREEGKKETPVIPKEELERLKRPGVVTVEEWAKRKQVEKKEREEEKKAGETETGKREEKESEKKEKKEEKPVVRKKIIKKVIAVKKEKE